jgi:hypothetical protein
MRTVDATKLEQCSIQVYVICIGHDVAYSVPMFMNVRTGDIHPGKWSDPYISRMRNAVELVAAVSAQPKQKHLDTVYRRWLQGLDTQTPFVVAHKVCSAVLNMNVR